MAQESESGNPPKGLEDQVMDRREAMEHIGKDLVTLGAAGTLSQLDHLMTPAHADETRGEKPPLSLPEVNECLRRRIKMMKLKDTVVHCGDDRAEEGTAAFGAGLMGVLYPVAKEIEERQGFPITDEQLDALDECYEQEIVLHTDTLSHGLGHVVEAIKDHAYLSQFFTAQDLETLQKEGIENNAHIQRLIESQDGPKIIEALSEVFADINCQGCGHAITVMKHSLLAKRMAKRHAKKALEGSPKHKMKVYQGPHTPRKAVIELKLVNDITSDDDMVPSRVNGGEHEAFFNEPQVAKYLIRKTSKRMSEKFPEVDWAKDPEALAGGALALHEKETNATAGRLADGYLVYTALYNEKGLVDVTESRKIG